MANELVLTKDGMKDIIESAKEKIIALLPDHMDFEHFQAQMDYALVKAPNLKKCTIKSVGVSIFEACRLGLDPSGITGEGYLIPYGKDCKFIIGYRGFAELARRSGRLKMIEARVVRDGDEFSYCFGTSPDIEHVPELAARGIPKLTFAYAIATIADEHGNTFQQFDVMSRAEVERIRDKSPGKNQAPWRDHFDEMAKKTVIRRIIKLLPLSAELSAAVAYEDADYEERKKKPARIVGGVKPLTESPESDAAPDASKVSPEGASVDSGAVDGELEGAEAVGDAVLADPEIKAALDGEFLDGYDLGEIRQDNTNEDGTENLEAIRRAVANVRAAKK